ncbi:MAG: DUF4143 domain-containing protein [Eubacteriales bacterium]|nr:DUF4143 domain-containing protein [Eubacteriales bacterium]
MEKNYRKRIIEAELERKLHSSGCVLVAGPKFVGKTTTCATKAKSITSLKSNEAVHFARLYPSSALRGEIPHLIDEWQKAPEIWNLIRDDLDKDYVFGKYLLTGSTTPVDPTTIQHSGAGRITRLIMRPFSLYESGESLGIVSLRQLLENPGMELPTLLPEDNPFTLEQIAFSMCRGGWPISCLSPKEYALDVTLNYYESLFNIENESDEFLSFLKNKDIDLLKAILKENARAVSSQMKRSRMLKEILESGIRSTLDEETFLSYYRVLENLYITYELPAWNLNLRSSVAVRTAPTHHFFDTSIALASLGITPKRLLDDKESFGLFFEDFALRDLFVYASALRADIRHYRDSAGQEVDAVLLFPDGEYATIEIKTASYKGIEEGISSLLSFEAKMEKNQLKKPRLKLVLTSHGGCLRDPRGVYVVPLSALKD